MHVQLHRQATPSPVAHLRVQVLEPVVGPGHQTMVHMQRMNLHADIARGTRHAMQEGR